MAIGLVLALLFSGGGQAACVGSDGRMAIEPPGTPCGIEGCATRSAPEQPQALEHERHCTDFLLAGAMAFRLTRQSQATDMASCPAVLHAVLPGSAVMRLSIRRQRPPVQRSGAELRSRLIRSTILLL